MSTRMSNQFKPRMAAHKPARPSQPGAQTARSAAHKEGFKQGLAEGERKAREECAARYELLSASPHAKGRHKLVARLTTTADLTDEMALALLEVSAKG